MKQRKAKTLVISPPVRRRTGGLWIAGFALLGHLAIAVVWALGGGETQALASPSGPLHGLASWYGAELHGHPTASGEPFDMNGLTAAHRTLPLGSQALVTNPANGRQVVVRINDRGPGRAGVMIDLSQGAARALGMTGSEPVDVTPLGP